MLGDRSFGGDDIPSQVREQDFQDPEKGLLLNEEQAAFARKLFEDNPVDDNSGFDRERLRKSDFYYLDTVGGKGKYVIVLEEEAEAFKQQAIQKQQRHTASKKDKAKKLIPIREKLPFTVIKDSENQLYAIYYGWKGYPNKKESDPDPFLGAGSEGLVKLAQMVEGRDKGKWYALKVTTIRAEDDQPVDPDKQLRHNTRLLQSAKIAREIKKKAVERGLGTFFSGVQIQGIAHYHGGKQPPSYSVLFEYVGDKELAACYAVAGGKPCILSFEERLRVCGDLIRTIAFLHEMGIVHRDIKPENVRYSSNGPSILIDYGFAASATQASGICGSLFYTDGTTLRALAGKSPDGACHIEGEEQRAEAYKAMDVYALGVCMWELLGLGDAITGAAATISCRQKDKEGKTFVTRMGVDAKKDFIKLRRNAMLHLEAAQKAQLEQMKELVNEMVLLYRTAKDNKRPNMQRVAERFQKATGCDLSVQKPDNHDDRDQGLSSLSP